MEQRRRPGISWFRHGATSAESAVTGAPFSADRITERVQRLADGTSVGQPPVAARVYRDSAGRTRTERSGNVFIFDYAGDVIYSFEAAEKVAYKWLIPAVGSTPVMRSAAPQTAGVPQEPRKPVSRPARMGASREVLGSQLMEGLPVEGTRFIMGDAKVMESWRCVELKIEVLTKSSDPLHGETTTRLTNIVPGEPDPSLFNPPPDYIIDERDLTGGW